MLRRAVFDIMLALLLIGMLSLVYNILSVKAEPRTWSVDDDGLADFHTIQEAINAADPGGSIKVLAGIYFENVNINKTVSIYAENGPEATLVAAKKTSNHVFEITANNVNVKGFSLVSATGRDMCGIYLAGVKNCTLQGNLVYNDYYGIYVYSSTHNLIENNSVFSNGAHGIYLRYSNYNVIRNNNSSMNGGPSGGVGILIWESSHTIIEFNTVCSNADLGICLRQSSSNCTIRCNYVESTIKNRGGIWLDGSCNYNTIFQNLVRNSITGFLLSSNNNIIYNNTVNLNTYGFSVYSSFNNVFCNEIAHNRYGIYIGALHTNNSFIHNDMIKNFWQVYCAGSNSTWDDGYPSGGNYWSDYTGVDLYGGPSQNEVGSDGVGDTPYVMDANNRDHYPLMRPYGAPPPPAYALTITTTVGGTTDPPPGTYAYTVNSTVQVTAVPDVNYIIDHWELDSVDVGSVDPCKVLMDCNHTLKAVFTHPPPLSTSISPLFASMLSDQSVTFTSTATGGYTPYSYQWHLNGTPISEATSPSWTFTPTTSGIYYIHLKVTDTKGNTAQSETALIEVTPRVPIGGHSFPIERFAKVDPLIAHLTIVVTSAITFTAIKRKVSRKTKSSPKSFS